MNEISKHIKKKETESDYWQPQWKFRFTLRESPHLLCCSPLDTHGFSSFSSSRGIMQLMKLRLIIEINESMRVTLLHHTTVGETKDAGRTTKQDFFFFSTNFTATINRRSNRFVSDLDCCWLH